MPPFSPVPFAERPGFADMRGHFALTQAGVLVSIEDLQGHRYWGERTLLVREDPAFCREVLGRSLAFSYVVDETNLVPVDASDPRWREKEHARRLDEALVPGTAAPRLPRF